MHIVSEENRALLVLELGGHGVLVLTRDDALPQKDTHVISALAPTARPHRISFVPSLPGQTGKHNM